MSAKNQTKPVKLMGIVNITPDSFSDGGRYLDPEAAYEQIVKLVDQGADIVDLGAESSRPGAELIDEQEEWRRLEPVLNRLAQQPLGVELSVDTNKPTVMRRLVGTGVTLINDIKGGADQETLSFLAGQNMSYCAMHMHRSPADMQMEPLDGEQAVAAVAEFFRGTHDRLRRAGFAESAILLDPGIGFGKTIAANLRLLQYSMKVAHDYALVIGLSRKSFIGRMLEIDEPAERDGPSKMLELALILAGARVIRTHEVETLDRIRRLLRD
jgi:dihydropteroate synthase